jgi:hypothetical protein
MQQDETLTEQGTKESIASEDMESFPHIPLLEPGPELERPYFTLLILQYSNSDPLFQKK